MLNWNSKLCCVLALVNHIVPNLSYTLHLLRLSSSFLLLVQIWSPFHQLVRFWGSFLAELSVYFYDWLPKKGCFTASCYWVTLSSLHHCLHFHCRSCLSYIKSTIGFFFYITWVHMLLWKYLLTDEMINF